MEVATHRATLFPRCSDQTEAISHRSNNSSKQDHNVSSARTSTSSAAFTLGPHSGGSLSGDSFLSSSDDSMFS
jgi:hypothetical protein